MASDPALSEALRRLDRRQRLQRCLERAAPSLCLGLGLAVAVVVLVKLTLPGLAPFAPAVLCAGLLLPLLRLPAWWSRAESRALLAGRLDLGVDARGLAMALAEAEGGADWAERLRPRLGAFEAPPLSWRPCWPAGLALLAALAALWLPARPPSPPPAAPAWKHAVERLEKRLDAARQADQLPEELADELQAQLARLAALAGSEGLSAAVWEGLDRVQAGIDTAGQEAQARLAAAMEAAEQAAAQERAALQEAGETGGMRSGQGLSPAEAAALAAAGLSPETGLPMEAGLPEIAPGMDPQALADLMEGLAKAGRLSKEQLAALQAAAKACSGASSGNCQGLSAAQAKALSERLGKELEASKGLAPAACAGLEGGRGGVSRGPGHAPLAISDQKAFDAGKAEALPQGLRLNKDGSITVALTMREAELDEAVRAGLQRSGLQDFQAGGADARRAAVAPRHRAAVGRYFAPPVQGATK